ncbi:hypothetical protein IJ076_02490 [Candidatus Saccharibacteria bacterium]|nr:hypothetical protein [Candidatus Saccharibacteria bacterium]
MSFYFSQYLDDNKTSYCKYYISTKKKDNNTAEYYEDHSNGLGKIYENVLSSKYIIMTYGDNVFYVPQACYDKLYELTFSTDNGRN